VRMRTGCITEHVPQRRCNGWRCLAGFCRPVSGTAAACGTPCSPGTLGGTCQRLAPPESFGKCTRTLRCIGRGCWRLGGGPGKWVPHRCDGPCQLLVCFALPSSSQASCVRTALRTTMIPSMDWMPACTGRE
jgi:hypothetical protein